MHKSNKVNDSSCKQALRKQQVRKFYEVLWDALDKQAIPDVLHEDFVFRGSLGQEKTGHAGFAEYVDMVHLALGDYSCIIEELVAEGEKVFAKMSFTGIHRNDFMGYSPTNKRLTWHGCALFTFREGRIAETWVLGDLKTLENQLAKNLQ
ncbi:ester cyclase [Aliamphritea ceti]|uniref:ester cyclase n=1 Tax=Aliamphritea ceti TaxID=1524258 RepID=UPI0021C3AD15|nr:ester cyclase [Aliamphritea ceti]